MSAYLEQLDSRKAEAANRMREILDGAAAENRELTAEEDANLSAIDNDLSRFTSERERFVAMEEKAKADSELRAVVEPIISVSAKSERPAQRGLTDMWAEIRSGARATGADFEYRALATSTDTIDQTFYDRVVVYQRTLTPMLNPDIVTVLATSRGEQITVPRLTTDTNHGGTVTAEAGTINAADPTISSVVLGAFKYAVINLWSAELGNDEVIGLEDLMARSTARDLSLDIGTHLTTGTGTVQPNGIITAASNGGTASGTANNTFIGPDDIIDLFYGRAAPYRANGTWLASNTGLAKIRKFKDADGNYIWQMGLGGQPDTVLGRPIFENPAMAAVASASKSVLFGDLSRYFVRRVTPARVELSRDYKFDTDQLALKTVERVDGNLVDTAAVAFLVSANA